MIVFDLPFDGSVQRVAAIGSCRIGVPVNLMYHAGAIKWLWTDLALNHTTAGARQLLDLARSGYAVSPFFRSMIYPSDNWTPIFYDPVEFIGSIDVFLIEICEVRLLHVGRWLLQINMFADRVLGEHPEIFLPWWNEVCKLGRATDPAIEQVLQAFRDKEIEMSPDLESVIRDIVFINQDEDGVRRSVSALTREFPGRWIFVSHFALQDVDSKLMNQRRELARWLRDAAEAAGAEFYDPSDLVAEIGRDKALAANGADIYHYSPEFEQTISDRYLELLRMGAAAGGEPLHTSPDTL